MILLDTSILIEAFAVDGEVRERLRSAIEEGHRSVHSKRRKPPSSTGAKPRGVQSEAFHVSAQAAMARSISRPCVRTWVRAGAGFRTSRHAAAWSS
jgi:hypothetical protein